MTSAAGASTVTLHELAEHCGSARDSGMQRLSLRIRGLVQGVCYRAETKTTATRLRLSGWVRNRDDGSVELVAEGPPAQLDALLEWCRTGPPRARVDALEPSWSAATGEFDEFDVRR
jgi:acylphosphatase